MQNKNNGPPPPKPYSIPGGGRFRICRTRPKDRPLYYLLINSCAPRGQLGGSGEPWPPQHSVMSTQSNANCRANIEVAQSHWPLPWPTQLGGPMISIISGGDCRRRGLRQPKLGLAPVSISRLPCNNPGPLGQRK